MSTYQKPTTTRGKIAEKTILTLVVIGALWFLWAAFLAPSGGCRPGWEVTASECGYDG